MTRFRPTAFVAACAFVFAACGGGGGDGGVPSAPNTPSPSPPSGGPPPSANVAMQSADDGYSPASHAFSPTSVTIARNGTVTWVNSTNFPHTVTFTTAGAPAHIAEHTSGSNSRTFTSAGTFAYQCTNHVGMTGTVTVQ